MVALHQVQVTMVFQVVVQVLLQAHKPWLLMMELVVGPCLLVQYLVQVRVWLLHLMVGLLQECCCCWPLVC